MMRAVRRGAGRDRRGREAAAARAEQGRPARRGRARGSSAPATATRVLVSALTGEGLEELRRAHRARVPRRRSSRSSCWCRSTAARCCRSCTTSPATSSARTPPAGVRVRARVPAAVAERLAPYAVNGRSPNGRGEPVERRVPPPQRGGPRAGARTRPTTPATTCARPRRRRIGPGERASVGTGIAVAIPEGHAGLVLPRSGLAARHGIALVERARPDRCRLPRRGARAAAEHRPRRSRSRSRSGDRIAQLVIVDLA